MEVISFDSFLLKDAIDNGQIISNNGVFSTVFLHGSNLLKLDERLYNLIAINCKEVAHHVFKDVYRFNKEPFVQESQIAYLLSRQPNVSLTDFDRGIVLVNDRICGTILTPHLDYQDLTNYQFTSLSDLLKILENILKALRELEENQISHEDLAMGENQKEPTFNILYKGSDIKLCDLSGQFINYQENFNPAEMYRQYLKMLLILINRIKVEYPAIYQMLTKEETPPTYEGASTILEKIYQMSK